MIATHGIIKEFLGLVEETYSKKRERRGITQTRGMARKKRGRSEQALFERLGHGAGARVNVQLGVDIAQMGVHCMITE
jgi:hypothetical protein